nr:hypothetical protein [Tanacetum cinerariifolium]
DERLNMTTRNSPATGENDVLVDEDVVEDAAPMSFPMKRFCKKRFRSIEYRCYRRSPWGCFGLAYYAYTTAYGFVLPYFVGEWRRGFKPLLADTLGKLKKAIPELQEGVRVLHQPA